MRKPVIPQAGAPVPGNQPTDEDNAAMFQQMMIKKYLNLFVESAANDEDPAPYAEMVINKVPHETLREWISKPSLAEGHQWYPDSPAAQWIWNRPK